MKLTKNSILFNAGGGLAVLIVGVYFVNTALYPDKAGSCSADYATLQQLPLEHSGGDLFTPADLQARLAGRDFGVLENTRVTRIKGEPNPVLEVTLPKGSLGPRISGNNKGGIGFQWRPSRVETAKAICLTYSVWLPPDFDFKRGGTLPGVYGANDMGRDDKAMFSVRYMWREGGKVELLVTLPKDGEPRTTSTDPEAFKLPLGKWIRLDQEIVLNTPGRKDGSIRVWADGALVANKQLQVLRDRDEIVFAGVQADMHYGGVDQSFSAPKDAKVRMSPFEFRMR